MPPLRAPHPPPHLHNHPPRPLRHPLLNRHLRIHPLPLNGGYTPTLNWYKQQIANLNLNDEASIPEERKYIQQPALLVTCTHDAIAVPMMQVQGMRPWAKDLRVVEIESGYWVQLEKAEEVNMCLERFIVGGR